MSTPPDAPARLVAAALQLFLAQGIKKTSMDEVAAQAGLTRITAYRYFADRQDLVRAAFWQIVAALEQTLAEIEAAGEGSIEAHLATLIERLSGLGRGDLPTRLEELARLYPDLHAEFHQARRTAIQGIFEQLFSAAERQGRLRAGLNRAVVQAYFSTAVVNVLADPQLVASGLAPAEIFETVQAIFLHGILSES